MVASVALQVVQVEATAGVEAFQNDLGATRTMERERCLPELFEMGEVDLGSGPGRAEDSELVVEEELVNWMSSLSHHRNHMFANFLIAVLLAIYLAAEPQLYIGGLIKLFPVAARPRARQVIGEIGETLRWWLIGKMGSMLCIGVLTCIGLWIIGVPLALTLGLIAGLLSFIPNFGPIMSAIPAVLFGFIESPATALYVIGLYLGVQFIESYLVTPWIERRTVSLPPALTITFQLLLSVLIGGLGLVLATPILAVIMVLVQMLYIEDVLGDVNTDVNEKDAAENPKTDKSVNNIELENND